MKEGKAARLSRLLLNGRCLTVTVGSDAQTYSPRSSRADAQRAVDLSARERIQAVHLDLRHADLLHHVPGGVRPSLVARVDVGRPDEPDMWSALPDMREQVLQAVRADAAALVVELVRQPDDSSFFQRSLEKVSQARVECAQYGIPLIVQPVMLQEDKRDDVHLVDNDLENNIRLLHAASALGADLIVVMEVVAARAFERVQDACGCPVLIGLGEGADPRQLLASVHRLLLLGADGLVLRPSSAERRVGDRWPSALAALVHGGADTDEAVTVWGGELEEA